MTASLAHNAVWLWLAYTDHQQVDMYCRKLAVVVYAHICSTKYTFPDMTGNIAAEAGMVFT